MPSFVKMIASQQGLEPKVTFDLNMAPNISTISFGAYSSGDGDATGSVVNSTTTNAWTLQIQQFSYGDDSLSYTKDSKESGATASIASAYAYLALPTNAYHIISDALSAESFSCRISECSTTYCCYAAFDCSTVMDKL